jgi:peroxiredoxin
MTLIGLLTIAAVIGLALLSDLGRGSRREVIHGARLPDFSVERFPQGTLALVEFRGRPLVINLLASWCGPCWEELPYFQEVAERYREKGLVVIGISVQDRPESLGEMVRRLGIAFPVGLDPTGAVAVDVFKLQRLPMTYFIARDGTIRSIWGGPIDAKSLDREVGGIL